MTLHPSFPHHPDVWLQNCQDTAETITGFLIGIIIYAVMIEAVGIFFSDDIFSYTLGLLFGIVIAVFLMIHMAKTLDKVIMTLHPSFPHHPDVWLQNCQDTAFLKRWVQAMLLSYN